MIMHLVLFKWKDEASPEAINAVMDALQGMKGKIPEILELSCGENFSERSQGFQHGLVVQLSDRTALDSYAKHPDHQEIVQTLIKPIVADVLALDYEVP